MGAQSDPSTQLMSMLITLLFFCFPLSLSLSLSLPSAPLPSPDLQRGVARRSGTAPGPARGAEPLAGRGRVLVAGAA